MEHLDADLTFPSAEMESLDFTTEECTSSSCLLQILPSDATYSQTGIDLNDYTETLSPGISLTGLEENVLSAETTVVEHFEGTDVLPSDISVSPTSKTSDSIGDARNLLDVPLFIGIQNTDVISGNIGTSDDQNIPTSDFIFTQPPMQTFSIGKQEIPVTQPNQNLSDEPKNIMTTGKDAQQVIIPPVRMPSFAYLSHATNSLSAVAPNVFLTSANQKGKISNFPSRKQSKSKEKKAAKRQTAKNTAKQSFITTAAPAGAGVQQLTELSSIDPRNIRVELTQVSNDTTIVRLSLIPEAAGTNAKASTYNTPLIVNKVHPSLVVNLASSEQGGSDLTQSSTKTFTKADTDQNLTKVNGGEEGTAEMIYLTKAHSSESEDPNFSAQNAQTLKIEGTDDMSDEGTAFETYPSIDDTLAEQFQVADPNEAVAVNWEEMTLGTAEAEMTTLLAESKLKMKTLAKLDEITIHITDAHCKVVDGKKRWCCDQCDKSYTTKNNLVVHTLGHKGIKPHVCMVCQRVFSQQSHLKTHMLTHGNIRPHSCKICHRSFTQLSHVKRHMSTHMDSWPYRCDICNRGFAYPSELKSHSEKHQRAKDHKCSECSSSFDQLKKLQFHMKTSHKDPEELTCKECGKRYMYPSQLREHVIKHSGNRPFACDQCGMGFMKEHHLRAHTFTHSGVKPYECVLCQRAFNQKANMLRHMLIHSVEKNFECEICNKQFSQLQTLKAHRVVHSKKKPFQCKICGKQFGRLHTLTGHMHIHQDSKPHVCFCGASFTLRGNLTRHQKVKHGIVNPSHSTEEEAAKILKAMSTKRSGTTQDNVSPTEEQAPSQLSRNSNTEAMDTTSLANQSVTLQQIQKVLETGMVLEDVTSTAPLVANFHTYCVKSKTNDEKNTGQGE